MRSMIGFVSALFAMALMSFRPLYAEDEKIITVAGFLNKGARSDDSVNAVLSRSLISVLQKIPGFMVTPFERVEKEARNKNLWTAMNYEQNNLLDFGLLFSAKTIVTGDYKIDKKKETIQINIFAYNVATGELTLKRTYKGNAGIDIFDTIDTMVKNITSLLAGRAVTFAKLDLKIANTPQVYHLYINGNFQKAVSVQEPFSENVLANEPNTVTLQKPDNISEVYKTSLVLKEGETFKITYEPAATVKIRTSGGEGSIVLLDGVPVGTIDKAGECLISITNLQVAHKVDIVKSVATNFSRSINLEEGKITVLEFGSQKYFGFSLYALTGGLGVTAGIDVYPLDFLRISPHGGIDFVANSIVPIAEADIALRFLALGQFSAWVNAGVSVYFTNPVIVSPMVKIEAAWWIFFANGGIRYSLYNNTLYPAVNVGIRF